MVRALIGLWERMGAHPTLRWARLALEVAWYTGLVLALHAAWDTPVAYFAYMAM